jgi:hypothetical protein
MTNKVCYYFFFKLNLTSQIVSTIFVSNPKGSLASGSRDGTIKLWNMTSFEEIMTLKAADHVNYLLALPGKFKS